MFSGEASAALVFLILYTFLFVGVLLAYIFKAIKIRSRYSLLFFHIMIRIGSQVAGVIFGIEGWNNIDAFIAYLILGAEGYFSLVITAYRFLISWHRHNLPSQISWLEPPDTDLSPKAKRRKITAMIFLGPLSAIFYHDFMVVVHSLLVIGNVLIIYGGTQLVGIPQDSPEFLVRVERAKILRTVGQSIFMAINACLIGIVGKTILDEKKQVEKEGRLWKPHKTLVILQITCLPLIVRGIFGILQACSWSFSFYNSDNYIGTGLTSRFLALEYVLGATMEWLACALMLSTFFTSRNDPKRGATEKHDLTTFENAHRGGAA